MLDRFACVLVALIACSPRTDARSEPDAVVHAISGFAQKGPLAIGTDITVIELDERLIPTGRTFSTTIESNDGSFALQGVALASDYVQLKADGFYFDEVRGELSSSRIILNALVDLAAGDAVNINLLTHLERGRIETLVASGAPFADAKAQARSEVLAFFGFQIDDDLAAERLSIARDTEGDAALLAASVLLQGHRTPAEVAVLLANLSADLKPDGVIDDASLGSELMNAGLLVDLAVVRDNLTGWYSDLGVAAEFGAFEDYVGAFVAEDRFEFTEHSVYPASGTYGDNFLVLDRLALRGGASFRAQVQAGASLKVVLTREGGNSWWIGEGECWAVTPLAAGRQEFAIEQANEPRDCEMHNFSIDNDTTVRVDYFENGDTVPLYSKVVSSYLQ